MQRVLPVPAIASASLLTRRTCARRFSQFPSRRRHATSHHRAPSASTMRAMRKAGRCLIGLLPLTLPQADDFNGRRVPASSLPEQNAARPFYVTLVRKTRFSLTQPPHIVPCTTPGERRKPVLPQLCFTLPRFSCDDRKT